MNICLSGRALLLLLLLAVFLLTLLLYHHRYPSIDNNNASTPIQPPARKWRIGIVVVANNAQQLEQYRLAQSTLKCYSAMQGYELHYLFTEQERNEAAVGDVWLKMRCPQWDVMFARHCALSHFMLHNPHFEWVLYVDADMGVVNPLHRIEEWIDGEDADLVFYNRMYNWEIMAGSYLAKNNEHSRRFLTYWADYHFRGHGRTDNEALHEVMMHHFASPSSISDCDKIYLRKDAYTYMQQFIACTRHHLGGFYSGQVYRDRELRVRVLGKGRGWCRDGGGIISSKWSERDFMLHLWKDKYERVPDRTYDSWQSPFVSTNENASSLPFDLEYCSSAPKENVFSVLWGNRYDPTYKKSKEEVEKLLAERTAQSDGYYRVSLGEALQIINGTLGVAVN